MRSTGKLLVLLGVCLSLSGCKDASSVEQIYGVIDETQYDALNASREYSEVAQDKYLDSSTLFKEDVKSAEMETQAPIDFGDEEKNKAMELMHYMIVNFDTSNYKKSNNRDQFIKNEVEKFYVNNNAIDSVLSYLQGSYEDGKITKAGVMDTIVNLILSNTLDERLKKDLTPENLPEFRSKALEVIQSNDVIDSDLKEKASKYVEKVYNRQLGTTFFSKYQLNEADILRLADYMRQLDKFKQIQLGKTYEQVKAELDALEAKNKAEGKDNSNSLKDYNKENGGLFGKDGGSNVGGAQATGGESKPAETKPTETKVNSDSVIEKNGSEKTTDKTKPTKEDDKNQTGRHQASVRDSDGALQKVYIEIDGLSKGGDAETKVEDYNSNHKVKYDLNYDSNLIKLYTIRFTVETSKNMNDKYGTYVPVIKVRSRDGDRLETYQVLGKVMRLKNYSDESNTKKTYDLVVEIPKNIDNFTVEFGENNGTTYKFRSDSLD